jgi:dTDP-4-dehydrorhamnose 3,5-epimerase
VIAQALAVPGAFVLTPAVHADERGAFLEWYRADVVASAGGRPIPLAQANLSVSRAGVLRGLHFSQVPPGQAKYVTCVRGAVLDAVVDLRVGSPTFGTCDVVRLDDRDRRAVHLAEGLGHAFWALEDGSTVVYACSTGYDPGREHGVDPLDPALAIPWPDGEPVLSAKDAAAPSLEQALERGILPRWEDCRQLDVPAAPSMPGPATP